MRPTPRAPITVLLADDHTLVREGIRTLLERDAGIRVVGEARTGREAVRMTRTLRPHIVVMDIAMPELNGVQAARQILAASPESKIVILSAHDDQEYVDHAIGLGAVAYLLKQSSAEVLVRAVRAAHEGETFVGVPAPAAARRGSGGAPPRPRLAKVRATLTSREMEVLQLIAEGSANKQIASALGVSIKTVEKHRQHLMAKLELHDTAGLTRYAIAAGIIESSVRLKTE